jgi:hypothetical protein
MFSRLPFISAYGWGAIAGVAGLVAVAIAVLQLLQMRPPQRVITCLVPSSSELTAVARSPDLSAAFTFRGKNVEHLWKVTLDCTNTGDSTIVGEGQGKNILQDSILLSFPENTSILASEVDSKDPTDLPVIPSVIPPNTVSLTFSQWRKNERVVLSYYVETPANVPRVTPRSTRRDILDGFVSVSEVRGTDEVANDTRWISPRLPPNLRALVDGVGRSFAAVLGALVLLISVFVTVESVQYFLWRRSNQSKFREFLGTLPESKISASDRQKYDNRPDLMPKSLWVGFEGTRIPVDNVIAPTVVLLSAWVIGGLIVGLAVAMATL